ncbi:hypothetical protein Taro_015560 [Colocasia esculenta]|uniref:Uncharacterized protein n=1 Tax=Colocasia esculenta TaxID=4460 RepID=A0A843UL55_COLES|nr:hypothetical protein [Colocasia esculenta]
MHLHHQTHNKLLSRTFQHHKTRINQQDHPPAQARGPQNNDPSFPLECSPKVELKPLPVSLKYIFLGENETWPIIIASDLTKTKAKIYKAKAKAFHDKHIHRNFFQVHDKVWLFHSRLRLFPGKLKSRWDGPYTVVKAYDNGAVIILDPKTGQSFTVNGQRLKHFFESPPSLKVESTKLAEPNGA